jgi:hypothetical protein
MTESRRAGTAGHRLPSWRAMHPADDMMIEAIQLSGGANAGAAEILARTAGLIMAARELAYLDLLDRHPAASAAELHLLLAERNLGPKIAGDLRARHASSASR